MAKIFNLALLVSFIVAVFTQSIVTSNDEDRYLIFVEHKYADCKKADGYKDYIDGIIVKVHDLIVSNKSTYKNQSTLSELEKDFDSKNEKSPYCYEISCINGSTVLFSYLSPELVEKVKAIKGVSGIEQDKKMSIDPVTPIDNAPTTPLNIPVNNTTEEVANNNQTQTQTQIQANNTSTNVESGAEQRIKSFLNVIALTFLVALFFN